MRFLLLFAAGIWLATGAYAQSVASVGPLRLGGRSPVQPGDPTAYPQKTTPRANFYVLVIEKGLPTMCTFEDCGEAGKLVEALGGWVTGDAQSETIGLADLDEIKVRSGTQSLVVVANKSARIIGLYPNQRLTDLPRILGELGIGARNLKPAR